MKINFLLPGSGQNPVGGFKVIYEYASGLAKLGNHVTVIHAPYRQFGNSTIWKDLRLVGVYWLRKLGVRGGYLPKSWFVSNPAVKMAWKPSLHFSWIPDADVTVASSWETAEWLNSYPENKGRKYYLLQHLESHFKGSDEKRVEATWRLPLKKIVIAKWLRAFAESMSEEAAYIPNGLDFDSFNLDVPINERQPARVMMMYHTESWKGTQIGLMALKLAKQNTPELVVELFGVTKPSEELPPWMTFHKSPSQTHLRKLYNSAAIFVSPSFAEGWGLPASEAMQCGAALCATDIGGHREFAIDGKTAMISPAGDIHRLAENIQLLIRHTDTRMKIAQEGNRFIKQFTWARAVRTFYDTLLAGQPNRTDER